MAKRGPKRTRTERERDLARIAHLDRLGYTEEAIAQELGVTQQQVSYDKREIWSRYANDVHHDVRAQVAKLEKQYDHLYNTAHLAYEQSKLNAEKTVTREVAKPVKDANGNPTGESIMETVEIATTVEGRIPASRFLDIMSGILAAKRALYGADAPKKVELKKLTIDLQQLMNELATDSQSPTPQVVEQQLESMIQQIPQLPPIQQPTQLQSNGNGPLPNGFKELPNGS